MARNDKLGKILLGSALAGAAVGALTYFLKKKGENSSWDDEDLEDFDDNLTDHKAEDEEDDDTPISREYVTIHTDHSHAAEAGEGSESFESEKEKLPRKLLPLKKKFRLKTLPLRKQKKPLPKRKTPETNRM